MVPAMANSTWLPRCPSSRHTVPPHPCLQLLDDKPPVLLWGQAVEEHVSTRDGEEEPGKALLRQSCGCHLPNQQPVPDRPEERQRGVRVSQIQLTGLFAQVTAQGATKTSALGYELVICQVVLKGPFQPEQFNWEFELESQDSPKSCSGNSVSPQNPIFTLFYSFFFFFYFTPPNLM